MPINTASRGAQLAHILATCGARLLVIEQDLVHILEDLQDASLAIDKVWVIGGAARFDAIEDPAPGNMGAPPSP